MEENWDDPNATENVIQYRKQVQHTNDGNKKKKSKRQNSGKAKKNVTICVPEENWDDPDPDSGNPTQLQKSEGNWDIPDSIVNPAQNPAQDFRVKSNNGYRKKCFSPSKSHRDKQMPEENYHYCDSTGNPTHLEESENDWNHSYSTENSPQDPDENPDNKYRRKYTRWVFEENWDDPNSEGTYVQKVFYDYSSNRDGESGKKRCYISQREKQNSLCLKIDSNKIGKIIGKQGAKIKELQEKTGTKIKVGGVCDENEYLTNVYIIGNEECKNKCKEAIEELTQKKQRNLIDIISLEPPFEEPELPEIDWDLASERADQYTREKWLKCPPIKKNFYIEDPEVAKMTEAEVQMFRRENNDITVHHVFGEKVEVPNPIKTFAQAFKHYPEIMREIEKQGFATPSPIQCQAWPILLSGKDLIGIAQTGTGKTLAFLLPALIHIDGQEVPRSERKGANVLVIAPTRELALQIEKEVQKYSYRDIKCVCIYGGGNRRDQMNIVTEGVEIIIATPGRLNDLILAKVIDLTSVTYIVLDEADRMLDMGFEPQIRKVLLDIRPDRQSVMTSATWPPNVRTLAERYMSSPIQVSIGTLDLAAVHSVTQTVLIVKEEEKRDYLFDFLRSLKDDDKVIVFVGRKTEVDHLSCDLTMAYITCQSIHGGRDQEDREQAIEDLKTGAVKILLATDVASRGLDICDITKVFNYDFPKNIEEYVHRVGRTGRAGKTGEAITLFTKADWNYAAELITIMEEANQPVPEELYDLYDSHASWQKRKQDARVRNRKSGRKGGCIDDYVCWK